MYLHDVYGDDELIFSFNTTALFSHIGGEIKGSWAVDLIFGSDQVDQLFGAGGDDFIEGGAGADTIDGGAGSDRLSGGVGDDIIWGKGANDIIFGDKGSDTLHGGLGADRLSGGAGNDKLYGGAGADTFVFTSYKHSMATARDMIYDFSQKQDDRIELSRIDARSATSKNDAFTFIGEKAFSEKAGELRYFHKSGDTFVYGDVNGDGKTDFALRLDKTIDLVKGDFIL